MKKLLVLDSNSIINRAFYGIRYLSAKDGTPTNAVYGFLNIMLKLIDELKPDYICAAFDLKAPTFRHKMYSEYKAQRKPMPDDLRVQLPLAKDILHAMNITILELEGYEADDIIGTVSRQCEESNIECMIATGDKDDLQLATQRTKVVLTVTRNGNNETTIYDDTAVKERYSVSPTEFIDLKALMGDTSDNIPGVKGIGEKTAISLISRFSSIEYIYDNIDSDEIAGEVRPSVLKKLVDDKEMAFLSKKLATIDKNVPIKIDTEECDISKAYNSAELYNLLARLGLSSIIKRMGITSDAAEGDSGDDYSAAMFSDINIIDCDEEKFRLPLGQTTAVIPIIKENTLAAAYVSIDKDVYVKTNEPLEFVKPLLEDENTPKIMFDAKEAIVALSGKSEINNICDDVIIGGYLLNPSKSTYSIDEMCMHYLNADIEGSENGSEKAVENKQLTLFDVSDEDEDTERISDTQLYARRAFALYKLRDAVNGELAEMEQTALYKNIELPLVRVLADMQLYGFKIDKQQLAEFGEKLAKQLEERTADIYRLAGEEFNINSPAQLGVILFEKLGLKATKKTKTGYSTSAEVLEKLKDEHEIIPIILEYRHLAKLKSTYCDGLTAVINPETGCIHSVFNQTVTVTGRISSTEPNMQNIPTRTRLGREMRKMFTASQDGRILVDADYSQIELRVLAHIANDKTMIEAFHSGEDIHAVTASQVLGIPLDEVTHEQRSSAKAVNFGIVYGMSDFSLAMDLGISVVKAKDYIAGYLEKYSGVREYMSSIKEQAKADGFVKTMMNRVRYIPELKSKNFNIRSFGERVALNTPIQGTAADIIKLAMVRVHDRLKRELPDARLILQVHDELIVDCREDDADMAERILREEMENAVSLNVPLVVDISRGWSWYDAK